MPLMASVERIILEDDGMTGRIEGEQRHAPLWWVRHHYVRSDVSIRPDGEAAFYHFEAAGFAWTQATAKGDNLTTVTMNNPWLTGVLPLRRFSTKPRKD